MKIDEEIAMRMNRDGQRKNEVKIISRIEKTKKRIKREKKKSSTQKKRRATSCVQSGVLPSSSFSTSSSSARKLINKSCSRGSTPSIHSRIALGLSLRVRDEDKKR